MEIKFNCTCNERKALVKAIGEILEVKPLYKGAPSFSFEIAGFVVDRNGTLSFDEQNGGELSDKLLADLKNRGFIFEAPQDQIIIEVPKTDFTEAAKVNLERLVESKGDLIKKALGTTRLPIEYTEDTILFPWFHTGVSSDDVKAYTHFVAALCKMAKAQKRMNLTASTVESEKFAFRCLLLRLGFIGDEYKGERKILLKRLSGSSAYAKNKPATEVPE